MKALLIINKRAGGLSAETIERSIQDALQSYPESVRSGVEIMLAPDIPTVHACIHERQGELDRVIAAGGDGTVVEVISAMLPYPHLKLGIIPVGTGNRLACNLGIPLRIRGALRVALQGTPYRIDIGRINDRYFAFMAGAGLDADIMDRIHPIEKRTMGIFAYFWKGIQRALRVPYTVFDIEADDRRIRCRGIGVIVANAGNLLGRIFTLTPGAQLDDGLFDICILASRNRMDYWATIVHILSQKSRGIAKEGVQHLRARRIVIRSRPRVKVQADGDVIGTTPIEIEALPGAVTVMVPGLKKHHNPVTESIQHASDHLRLVFRELFHI